MAVCGVGFLFLGSRFRGCRFRVPSTLSRALFVRLLRTCSRQASTGTVTMQFNSVEELIAAMAAGEIIVLTDDESRENEGDLVMAAEAVTPEAINFMAKHGRGLICTPVTRDRALELGLYEMAPPEDPFQTAFTVSVDAREGVTTGISAYDRALTIQKIVSPKTTKTDFVCPGHVFPLIAKDGGTLVRAGHTEATVDLARLAGSCPAGVICEIMNDDGTMARLPDLTEFVAKHNLKWGTIADLIAYRRRAESLVEKVRVVRLPTEYAEFDLHCYVSRTDGLEHLALVLGDVANREDVLVRVHSECLTGDVFQSRRCDCGSQLHQAMRMVAEQGVGVIVYMRQEGRGIGLVNKLHAYHLQDHGLDTVEANERLGFPPDLREYGLGAQILLSLGIRSIRLMTNNPKKIVGLEGYGLRIVERVAIVAPPEEESAVYLRTKKERMGHLL